MAPYRLAVLNSHVIQYFAPLYRRLAQEPDIDVTVYYCSRQGLDAYTDPGFGGQLVQWDVPLLEGYRSVFLDNWRHEIFVKGFWSLVNPGIVAELRRNHFDAILVHGHNYATYLLACLAARWQGTPIFTRVETHLLLQRSRLKRLIREPLLRLFYSQCAACLAIGTRNAEFYRHHGVPDRKIFLVPYTVNNERFMAQADACRPHRAVLRAELGLRPDLPVLLFASKFIQRKHPLDVLRAKAELQWEGTECAVLLIGAGEEEQALRQYCNEQGLRDVYFLGFRNQSELPRYYAIADVFILPSENEPWGLVINEVMCAGVAVVATEEVGAVADLVRPGENGMLYPAQNVAALTAVLRGLVRDPHRCRRMGLRSREIIADWSYEHCVEGVRTALRSVADRRR